MATIPFPEAIEMKRGPGRKTYIAMEALRILRERAKPLHWDGRYTSWEIQLAREMAAILRSEGWTPPPDAGSAVPAPVNPTEGEGGAQAEAAGTSNPFRGVPGPQAMAGLRLETPEKDPKTAVLDVNLAKSEQ